MNLPPTSSLRHVVVLCDYGHVNGGTAKVAIASIHGLVQAGLSVSFCFGVGPLDDSLQQMAHDGRLAAHDFQLNDLFGEPNAAASAFKGLWKPQAAKRLGQVLQHLPTQHTVVHLHSWMQSLTASVLGECVRRQFRLVCTLHDYIAACPNGGFYDYQQQVVCRRHPLSLACVSTHCDSRSYGHKLWRVARQGVQRYIGQVPSAIQDFIAVSSFSEAILRPHLPAHARLFNVPNPVDIGLGTPPGNAAMHERFLFLGKLAPHKGATLLAQAAARIDAPVDFLGHGDDHAAVRRINPRARLLGWQSAEHVQQALRSSRCLVFPSVWYETQGLVVLEAAALGLPAIVSDACAARDVVVDGLTGLLFRSGDIDDLAAKMQTIQNDPALAARMGQAAHERFWRQPTGLQQHIEALLKCYEAVLRPAATHLLVDASQDLVVPSTPPHLP